MDHPTLTVMVLTSDPGDTDHLRRCWRNAAMRNAEWIQHETADGAFRDFNCRGFDLAFLDLENGSVRGMEVLRQLRGSDNRSAIVVLTGQEDGAVAAECMRQGADDFLVKGEMSADLFRRSVDKALAQARQRQIADELAERNERIEHLSRQLGDATIQLSRLSRIDPLTELLNRAAWQESAEMEHERSVRYGRPYCVIMIDVDHFKSYNDGLGHQAGDECLKRIAHSILENCRGMDLAGRFGGEEFIVLAPETDLEGGLSVARRICQAVRGLQLPHPKNPGGKVTTVSAGVSSGPQGGWESAVRAADEALYDAKKSGRNKVCGRQRAVPDPHAVAAVGR